MQILAIAERSKARKRTTTPALAGSRRPPDEASRRTPQAWVERTRDPVLQITRSAEQGSLRPISPSHLELTLPSATDQSTSPWASRAGQTPREGQNEPRVEKRSSRGVDRQRRLHASTRTIRQAGKDAAATANACLAAPRFGGGRRCFGSGSSTSSATTTRRCFPSTSSSSSAASARATGDPRRSARRDTRRARAPRRRGARARPRPAPRRAAGTRRRCANDVRFPTFQALLRAPRRRRLGAADADAEEPREAPLFGRAHVGVASGFKALDGERGHARLGALSRPRPEGHRSAIATQSQRTVAA